MHKYQPRLTITPQDGLREPQHFSFPETEFVAVTAYQNANASDRLITLSQYILTVDSLHSTFLLLYITFCDTIIFQQ